MAVKKLLESARLNIGILETSTVLTLIGWSPRKASLVMLKCETQVTGHIGCPGVDFERSLVCITSIYGDVDHTS